MGALTGNSVQSTYLDLVQLGKSGAGLPSHAGKEAALYDGSGAQILGRTAVRSWMDPHPDAASFDETWEFSETGDMTQAALEASGWTFDGCTAVVAGGLLVITAAGAAVVRASLSVSFAGDFDVCITPAPYAGYVPSTVTKTSYNFIGGGGVADYRAGVADVAHYGIAFVGASNVGAFSRLASGAWTTLGGTAEDDNVYSVSQVVRVFRYSSTLEVTTAGLNMMHGFRLLADDSGPNLSGFANNASISDSSTFNKLFITASTGNMNAGEKFCIASLRRFQ